MTEAAANWGIQEQQVLFCWIGGHGTDP